MKPPFAQGLAASLMLALGAVSLLIDIAILRIWWRDGLVLGCRPRRPVPWGPIGLLIASYFILQQVLSLFYGEAGRQPSQAEFTRALLLFAAVELTATAIGIVLLVRVSGASRADLGVPRSPSDVVADSLLGVVVGLAAVLPVFLVLVVLVAAFGDQSQNPLLERMVQDPSPQLLAVTFLTAVLAAPVFEEFVFRLLIQGWLEKILIPPQAEMYQPVSGQTGQHDHSMLPEEGQGDDDRGILLVPGGNGPAVEPTAPAERLIPARTYWAPIVISSVLFALAHWGQGYGYSPIPLFLLAAVFGYIYQRTHRIVPCIVAHMLFNGINIFMAWLQIMAA
jgi:membrane protease YdiL (CAAX protease family)